MNTHLREIIVDSFAGGGGASLGIERALGRSPDIAINHDEAAIAMHAANHPATRHLQHNVWKVDPSAATGGAPVGLMWASPDCKHFSKAKGGKPVARNIRDLAWVVVSWARQVRPRVICLENVEEFRTWGPLDGDNRPDPERKGETFRQWVGELRRLGYRVEHRELRACDYGAPTIRKRLFLIARCDGRPIVWPKPSHGDPRSVEVKAGRLKPWRTAAGIIDWSLACPSIFLTREEARALGVKRPLAEATMARIAKGVKRYVLDAKEPFVVTINHSGEGFRGQGLDEPFRTVAAARDAHGLVAPVFAYGQQGGAVRDANAPLHTVTASAKDTNAIVAPTLVGCGGRAGQSRPRSASEPLATITSKADTCLVAAHLTKFNTGSVGASLDEPAPTVTANSFLQRPGGAAPIGIVSAHLSAYYGDGDGSTDRSAPADEPLRTVTTENRHAVVAAFLAQHNSGVVGHDAREPVSTLTRTGSHQAVVSAGLMSLKGAERRGASIDAPHATVTAQGCHSADVRAFLVKYYGEGGQDRAVGEPLHTIPTRDRFGLVTVAGEVYEIADIGMRMLTPRELFRAQGFPDSYDITTGPGGRRLTQAEQIGRCGNSVCPDLAEAIVRANYAAQACAPVERDFGPMFTVAAE
jgi:DNA (cytosine-5)-methyltransferase 1